jgi:arylsulfatase A-like enzyme
MAGAGKDGKGKETNEGSSRTDQWKRREFLKSAAAATAIGSGTVLADQADGASPHTVTNQVEDAGSQRKRPNIIFFFSDQQRWDSMGCYGQKLPISPNLDAMAAEGVQFEYAFTCQPVCGPARSCLQTGKYATETGCFRNNIALPTDETTIAHLLSDEGYEVGYLGKWHLASTGLGDVQINNREKPIPSELRGGYKDYWLASDVLEFTSHAYEGHMFNGDNERVEFPEDTYRVDAQTDFAIDYLNTRDGERPFFLFLSYIEPHHQNDHRHFEGPEGSKERWKDYEIPGDLEGTNGDWRAEMPDYLGCCNALDTGMGRIREELERLGLTDDTVILYTSDHACHFKTRNGEYKRACHDNAIRVPMLATGPGFQGGQVVDQQVVSLIDIPPTILAAAGADVPESMRGRPLQILTDESAENDESWPEEVFVQISESQVGRAVRTLRWKYSVRAPGVNGGASAGADVYVEDFLYDLEADPHERTNLVADPNFAEVRDDMAARLIRRMVEAGEAEPEIRSAS